VLGRRSSVYVCIIVYHIYRISLFTFQSSYFILSSFIHFVEEVMHIYFRVFSLSVVSWSMTYIVVDLL